MTEQQLQDLQFKKDYEQAKLFAADNKDIMMRMEPLPLDLKVRCLFEEDLQTLAFPKVKEFLFRVSRQSPLEVAAKALAKKNGHENWRDYSFSYICSRTDVETKLYDLAMRFDAIAPPDELNLFYRVKKLGASQP
jgi:hypothetical protein